MNTLTLLTAETSHGRDFARRLEHLSRKLEFRLVPQIGFGPSDFIKRSLCGSLLLVDISMDEGAMPFDSVFPVYNSRTVFVSRTHTPLNFRPMGNPVYDLITGNRLRGFPEFGGTVSNEEIIAWLEVRLPEFVKQSRFAIPLVTQILGIKRANDDAYLDVRREGQIFLSYRSSGIGDIAELARNIYRSRGKTCRYFPPGVLSREAMSRMRRWNLLSLLDRYLSPADEVWTCLSDAYFLSWWTYGEFVTATHRMEGGFHGKSAPRLRKFQDGQVNDWPNSDLPQISKAEHKRIARYYAFCDSYQMGPEAFITHDSLQQLNLKSMQGYYADDVWSPDFWLNPIVECDVCRARQGGYDRLPVKFFLWHGGEGERSSKIEPDVEFLHRELGIIELNFEALPKLAASGVVCECGNRIELEPGPPQYLFVFAPQRNEQDTPVARQLGRKWNLPECAFIGRNLLALPTYLVKSPH